ILTHTSDCLPPYVIHLLLRSSEQVLPQFNPDMDYNDFVEKTLLVDVEYRRINERQRAIDRFLASSAKP
ncbi:hypothetical protein IFR05_017451, partial [Cadophora sp. M221]